MNIKKECVGCGDYFDEHDGSEIFVCPTCKEKYVEAEERRIDGEIRSNLTSEIKNALGNEPKINGGKDNYHLKHDWLCISVNVITKDELAAEVAIDSVMGSYRDNSWACRTFDLRSPGYLDKIVKWVGEELDRYDTETAVADEIYDQLEKLDGMHRVIRDQFYSAISEKWGKKR